MPKVLIKTCKQCRKAFKCVYESQKFCSQACYHSWRSENRLYGKDHPNWKGGKSTLVCKQCGRTFEAYRDAKFCSIACYGKNMVGKGHHRWNRVTKICKYCGETFDVPQFRKESAIFCSVKCARRWQTENNKGKVHPLWKKAEMACEFCGETFEIIPCRIKTGRRFCSAACMGKQMRKEGKPPDPYPAIFNKSFKRAIRKRDDQKCAICRLLGRCVHHIDYDKQNTTPENCVTLCCRCHPITNSNRDYWQPALVDLMEKRQEQFSGFPCL